MALLLAKTIDNTAVQVYAKSIDDRSTVRERRFSFDVACIVLFVVYRGPCMQSCRVEPSVSRSTSRPGGRAVYLAVHRVHARMLAILC